MSADESEFHFCRKWVIIWALTKVKSRFVFVSVHVRDRANENDRRNSLSFSFLSARKYPPYSVHMLSVQSFNGNLVSELKNHYECSSTPVLPVAREYGRNCSTL